MQAGVLASQQGKVYLAELQQGKPPGAINFDKPTKIGREDLAKSGLDLASMQAIYRTSVKKLPAFTGVTLSNGDYALYKISAVSINDILRQQTLQILPFSVGQAQSEQVVHSYVESLRNQGKVKIKQDVLDKVGAEQ